MLAIEDVKSLSNTNKPERITLKSPTIALLLQVLPLPWADRRRVEASLYPRDRLESPTRSSEAVHDQD